MNKWIRKEEKEKRKGKLRCEGERERHTEREIWRTDFLGKGEITR